MFICVCKYLYYGAYYSLFIYSDIYRYFSYIFVWFFMFVFVYIW